MKTRLFALLFISLFISCSSSTNSPEFIAETTGRYLFNADEAIEIYFKEAQLFAKWRGNEAIEPLKVNDSTFYIKEMNEKLIFISKPNIHIKLAKKREHKGKEYTFIKLDANKKTPSEYFANNQYDLALKGYLEIQKKDSLSRVINQWTLNSLGYRYMQKKEYEKAIEIFKINTALYPKSSNTYDSAADAYLKINDTINAIEYYKKALAINPEHRSSKRMLKRITKKK